MGGVIPPLLILLFFTVNPLFAGALAVPPVDTRVTFQTQEGYSLPARMALPAPGGLMLVLLHGLGSTRAEWEPLEKILKAKGYGTLAYDARGHGDAQTATLHYKNFTGDDFRKMTDDLTRVVSNLVRRYKIPKKRIVLAGASLGANVALNVAAKMPEVAGVMLLSPGLSYATVETVKPIMDYAARNRPIFLAAAPGDGYAFDSTMQLSHLSSGKSRFVVGEGSAHGAALLKASMLDEILKWLSEIRDTLKR